MKPQMAAAQMLTPAVLVVAKNLKKPNVYYLSRRANCSISVTWYIILQWKWMLYCYTHMHTHKDIQRKQKYYSVSKYYKILLFWVKESREKGYLLQSSKSQSDKLHIRSGEKNTPWWVMGHGFNVFFLWWWLYKYLYNPNLWENAV